MHYNTTNEKGVTLQRFEKITGKQERYIYRMFKMYNALTTDQIYQIIKSRSEKQGKTIDDRAIISIRRAVTDLYNAGLIEKTEYKKKASSGRMNYVYKIIA